MKKLIVSALTLLLFAFLGITSVMAQEAEKPAAPAGGKTEQAKAVVKHAKAEVVKPESLSGTLTTVDTAKKLVIVTGGNGVPYDFKVGGTTKIKVAGKKAKLDALADQTTKQVTVSFIALRTGNVAKSIEVSQ